VITDAALSKKGALSTNAIYAQLKTISKLLDMLIFLAMFVLTVAEY
jgi:hypothetical protein